MKTSTVRAATAIGALAALLSACGGNVNLGGQGSQANGAAGAAQTPDQTEPPAGERVLERSNLTLNEVIVAGDYLYLAGGSSTENGIFRCRKADCEATFGLFFSGPAMQIQAFGDRLGFTRSEWDSYGFPSYGLASVALSDAEDEQLVIGGLPGEFFLPALFYDDFVLFSIVKDRALYRCSLPACAGNPERLAGTRGHAFPPRAEADYLFWFEGSFIYRSAGYGTEPAMALLPDDSLSEAPAGLSPHDRLGDVVEAIDVSSGLLYASVGRPSEGQACDTLCPHDVVAWPVLGGTAQHFFRSETRLQNLRIFGSELVWLGPSAKTPNSVDAATISTCRIEACESTRRELGETTFELAKVAADEHHVYWIAAEPMLLPQSTEYSSVFEQNQIQRAPRLRAP